MSGAVEIFVNARARMADRPVLSVLIPFYNASPGALLADLGRCAAGVEAAVEIVCADDASPDRTLAPAVERLMAEMEVACRLLKPAANLGRSRIRNLLAAAAEGQYLLYLDGDMRLRDPAFLRVYLDLIAAGGAAIACGGFEMPELDADSDRYDLHIYDSCRSHCLPAAERRKQPAKYTYTSNLLVRRDLMLACPFGEEFAGWGWEDVDWALRAAERATIVHIDNPAVHAGFSTAEALLAKYRESVENFRRLCLRHPDKVRRFPIYRASRLAGWLPCAGLVQRALQAAALSRRPPLRVRHAAMKLLRACLYRDVVRSLPAA